MPTVKSRRDELVEAKRSAIEEARNIAKAAEEAGRDFTADERAAVAQHMEKAREADSEIKTLDDDRATLDELDVLGRTLGDQTKSAAGQPIRQAQTLGDAMLGAPEWKAWMDSVAPNGHIPDSAKGLRSPVINLGGLKAFTGRGAKDIISGSEDTRAGAAVDEDFRGIVDLGTFQRPLVIADLITRGSTESDTVEYVRVSGWTNNAAMVAEATGSSAGTGSGDVAGTKPESDLTFERVTETVKTLAHWEPMTKRALSDAGQVRTILDNFLRYGLNEELEDQVISGDGTGENFTGILETSGIQTVSWDTDLLTTTRQAKTAIKVNGRTTPTAYVFHPNDNERIDLLKTDDGAFHFGGPAAMGTQTLWGVPRLESEAVPEGTGILADWRMAALWDREQASIQVSDSHSDFFVRNLVAVLAEARAAFGVIRPAAFAEIDLTSA